MINQKDYAIVLKSAEIYENELLNTNLLFVYLNRNTGKYEFVETKYLDRSFRHLTGIQYDAEDNENSASHFFKLAIKKRLDREKCYYKEDGTTTLKLQVLLMAMNIKKNARMIGDYNGSHLHIMADKMCGSTSMTIAYVNDRVHGYCPSSVLQQDIRNLVKQFHTVHAIYQKSILDEKYNHIFYEHKQFDKNRLPKNIKEKLLNE